MKKVQIAPCPFCGKRPTGKRFCGSEFGPSLVCDHCGAEGPPSEFPISVVGIENAKHRVKAVARWNGRARDDASWRRGVEAAADFVEMFDRRVNHPYLLSRCILGKFNLLPKSKIKKNPHYSEGAEPKTRLEIGLIRAALIWHAVKVFKRYPNAGEDKGLRRAAIALLKGQPNDGFEYPKKGRRAR